MATISSQVIGWVRKRPSLPRRPLRSWLTLPERGFGGVGASGAAHFSSSCRRRETITSGETERTEKEDNSEAPEEESS